MRAPSVDTRHNQIAVFFDSALFGVGTYFIPMSTVLIALASQLTQDKVLIGLVPLGWQAAFLLPQLIAARLIHGKTRTKQNAIWPTLLLRPLYMLFPIWLLLYGNQYPTLTVWLMVIALGSFMLGDSFATAAWFDMIGRIFTPAVKGRVMTMSGVFSSVLGIGVSLIVAWVLGLPSLPFPWNYAVLLILSNVAFFASFLTFLQIREVPATAATHATKSEIGFLPHLLACVRRDAALRRALWVRVLTTTESMAAAFYIVFAREQLGLPESAVGWFTGALVVGGILGTSLFGWVYTRSDSRRVIHAAISLQLLGPILALLVALFVPAGSPLAWLGFAMMFVVFVINGANNRANMLGSMSYEQAAAADVDRPAYVGALNTVGGVGALMPVLGGIIIQTLQDAGFGLSAYPVVFAIAALLCGVGVLVGFRLPALQR